jgi:membrane-associated phospholipid phosphatase
MRKMKSLWVGLAFLAAFALWTALVRFIDVQAIGPNGSSVGFAALNKAVHETIGVHWGLYTVTDWLGLIPIVFVLGFALLGLVQFVRRRSLFKVDRSILVLGGFYIVVMAMYLLFEEVVINYRPVLIDSNLEASYPSSTTILALCVLPTAMMQLKSRIRHIAVRRAVLVTLGALTAFMVVGRLLSGVHWLTDIIGGVLLSVGLVVLYAFAIKRQGKSRDNFPDTV